MNTGVIATRYAKALLDYAVLKGAEDATYSNMMQLLYTLQNVRELPVVLRNPSLSKKERVNLLCSAVEPSTLFKDFAQLVVRHGREDMLLFIAHAYITLYRKSKGIYAAKFVTAFPLDDGFAAEVEAIIEKSAGAKVELECVTDESLIGGFVIEANSLRLDASIKGRLAGIKKQLVKLNRKLL